MSTLRFRKRSFAIASIIFLANTSSAQQATTFPVISLTAGIHVVKAEVASNEAQREQGLMFRKRMGQNEGMVFLFDAPSNVCMWMKNTLIPLSVAFIDSDGRIINIEDMDPQTTAPHCAKKRAQYALEMNRGWFKQRDIKANDLIGGLPR